jgi:CRISPR system Cascade subunit CasA
MNVAAEAWIPIVRVDGTAGKVGLREAFERGQEIRDLALRPHERIAVMRLLLCVTQAALDGPTDQEDWKVCRKNIIPTVLDYLKRWQGAFELFGTGGRFLQVPNLRRPAKRSKNGNEEATQTSKLDLALATGNNSTLFDNGGGGARTFAPSDLALGLLTFQCFSPGGRIGLSMWGARETSGNGSSDHAPCLAGRMLHAVLRGENLIETLHRNLMSKRVCEQLYRGDRWGQPVWEKMPRSMSDAGPVRNATQTYLGRLVPLSRAIQLGEDCRGMILANGLGYPSYPEWREPSATIVLRKVKGQPERLVLPASADKAVWRELHALTVKSVGQNPGGPAALQNIPEEDESFDLWVGGLISDQAKPVDTVESVFHVPASMLSEPSQNLYEDGVHFAEWAALRLRRAVSVYHKELGDDLDRPEVRDRRDRVQTKAISRFWTEIENALPQLLEAVETPVILGLEQEWIRTRWGQSIWRAAHRAYEDACAHETARQLRAYALARQALFSLRGKGSNTENKTEGRE